MLNRQVNIFLSGSVKKGVSDARSIDHFWKNEDVEYLLNNLKFGVSIHNPNDLEISLTDAEARFITDFKELLTSDLMIVNAITKKGIGVGAEMFFARYNKIPVYTISPLGSYYHKNDGFEAEWTHPFIYELSNCIFESVAELVNYLNEMWEKGKIQKNILSINEIQDTIDKLLAFDAGYDEGYKFGSNFWGQTPAQFVQQAVALINQQGNLSRHCLDLGCGHGKNAVFAHISGLKVTAIDCSYFSILQARNISSDILWKVEDIRKLRLERNFYSLVIMTGSLHCLDNREQIASVINEAQEATIIGGYNVISAFNDRYQDLSGHPDTFVPCLLKHNDYLMLYIGWEIINATDTDLLDIHPNNNIPHCHSITRLLVRKLS